MGNWIRPRWPKALLPAVLAVTIMTGCTAGGGDSSGDSSATRLTPEPTGQVSTPEGHSDVEQRADLRDEKPKSWSRYEIVSDHSVRVYFLLDDPTCFGARATVDEDTTTIRITLYEGTLPDAPDACAADAAYASLLLTTRNPIGTRSIVPG